VVGDSRQLPLMALTSIASVRGGVGYVLEGDDTLHIFAGEYCLVTPFDEDLDVGRWHGEGRVSSMGAAAQEESRAGSRPRSGAVGTKLCWRMGIAHSVCPRAVVSGVVGCCKGATRKSVREAVK